MDLRVRFVKASSWSVVECEANNLLREGNWRVSSSGIDPQNKDYFIILVKSNPAQAAETKGK